MSKVSFTLFCVTPGMWWGSYDDPTGAQAIPPLDDRGGDTIVSNSMYLRHASLGPFT